MPEKWYHWIILPFASVLSWSCWIPVGYLYLAYWILEDKQAADDFLGHL